jgi:type I restriction enzyme M protein
MLFRGGPDAKLRKKLIEEFYVHTILSLPAGCFLPYTAVKTNVIFFDRPIDGSTTDKIWYYELTNDGFELTQTRRPVEGDELPDFLSKWESRKKGSNSWSTSVKDVIKRDFDLSAANPSRKLTLDHRPALEIVQSIRTKEERIIELLSELEVMLEGQS